MRSEDSHTCRCLPNFSVPQLELPYPKEGKNRVLPQDVWPEIWPFLTGRLLDWRFDLVRIDKPLDWATSVTCLLGPGSVFLP